MSKLRIETAPVFVPLLEPKRYKGAKGGRGSGKSHFFAEMLVEECLLQPGTRAVCIREKQKSLKDSSKHLIEKKITDLGVGAKFEVLNTEIRTPGDGVILFQGMQDHTAESIKSLEGCRIAWADEAQSISARSLSLLRPTIRVDLSELWFSWNPTRKSDAVEDLFRDLDETQATLITANWQNNPWFNATMEAERQLELAKYPERYDHTWEGGYAKAFEGAYYAAQLTAARQEGRIGPLAFDPLMRVRVYCDLGGTGAKADAFAMWPTQFIGAQIRVRDYYEAVGQPLAAHIEWLHSKGYRPERADIYLPHDGATNDRIYDVSFQSAFKAAGYTVKVIPNQGKGAARMRIEAARRVFPSVWFDETSTEAGRDALGFYHEKKSDDERNVGLGPEHDWSSHGADGFGLMCVAYEDPSRIKKVKIYEPPSGAGWMAS